MLAAIEGLNIGVQRVIMPMFEKRQQEEALAAGQDVQIDKLDPPIDPLRHYYAPPSSTSTARSAAPSLFGSSSPSGSQDYATANSNPNGNTSAIGGFDMDSIDSFDSQGLSTTAGGAVANYDGVSASDSKENNSATQGSSNWFKW